MWPWGHLAVGYLLYSTITRQRGRRPEPPAVAYLVVGTLLPDLVDKPLSWTFGLLNSGRSLGHSVIIAVVMIGLLYAIVAPRVGRTNVIAFGIGWLSHPLADLPFADLLVGDLEYTTYLVWPLIPAPPYETDPSFLAHFRAFELGPWEVFQIGLFGAAMFLWYLDGCPGLGSVREHIS